MADHLAAFEYGHLSVGLVDWYGWIDNVYGTPLPGNAAFGDVLNFTWDAGSNVRWALVDDTETTGGLPRVSTMVADLQYIAETYSTHPAYWRLNGRFVVLVRFNESDPCSTLQQWLEAEADLDSGVPPMLLLRSPSGPCPSYPADGYFDDALSSYGRLVNPGVFLATPGFLSGGGNLSRDAGAFAAALVDMAASDAGLHLVGSFNDWNTGSEVESAAAWATDSGYGTYLDVLHEHP